MKKKVRKEYFVKKARKISAVLSVCLCVNLLFGCGAEVNAPNIKTGQTEELPRESEAMEGASKESVSEEPSSTPNPPDEEPTTEESPTEESAEVTAESKLARAAYKEALETILNELKLPDGELLYYDGFFEFSQNKFAIGDVDCDGMEELVFSYTTGAMADMNKYVYGYNAETDTIYLQLDAFSMTFYDNGIVKSKASHNHGRGDKLWPYTLYYYNENQDNYHFGVNVDSWEKEYYGDTAGEQTFPAEADVDGDGIVYYPMEYDDYSYENPIDGAEYQKWYEGLFQDAEVVELEYKEMTKENIAAI